ncbi:hypothetical protein HYS10_00245 [Candidatus Collierbacteria bacterium]|nr:hypothetical protein [Candidatus Collierbacteria bacterium]
MNWERYYQENNVRAFNEQRPYYAHVLQRFAPYLTHNLNPNEPIYTALGGLHPKVTRPEHFINLCQKVFESRQTFPHIFDQNEEALENLTGDGYTAMRAQLENLPENLPLLNLLVCDYTIDFMSDAQIQKLNVTLPARLHPNGVLVLTLGDPLIPSIRKLQTKIRYGVATYYRNARKIAQILTNFKLVYLAETDNGNQLAVFTHQKSPLKEHQGRPYGLSIEDLIQ